MGNYNYYNKCQLYNDTNYDVRIEDYDGNRILGHGDIESNWLVKGPYYINLVMIFPGFGMEKKYLYGSEYQNKTFHMSELFRDDIRNRKVMQGKPQLQGMMSLFVVGRGYHFCILSFPILNVLSIPAYILITLGSFHDLTCVL